MKLFITALLVAVASAGRLENTYLPPSTARFAGGSGNVLAAPSLGLGAPTSYSAPAFGGVPVPGVTTAAFNGFVGVAPTPSVSYGVPVAAVKTYSAPVTPPVPILRLNSDNNGDGSYRYDYETANHIAAQESGHLSPAGSSEVQGGFSYLAPNGETISVNYVADENGFRPEGSHLPTPPPVPEAILKSLEINAAEEARAAAGQGHYSPAGVEVVAAGRVSAPGGQYLPPGAGARQAGYRY